MTTERSPLLSNHSDTVNHRRRITQNGTVAADLAALESDDTVENSIFLDSEAAEAAQEYSRIQEDMLLSVKYKSLDYDTCENVPFLKEENSKGYFFALRKQSSRWIVMFLIGVTTGCVASAVDIAIEELADVKYGLLKTYIDKCSTKENNCMVIPYLLYCALNVGCVLIASILAVYISPCAAGSGIPQIKCFLNGVVIPEVVRFKTLVAKVIGVVFSVTGGLSVGQEGPLVHSGSIIAAGISQGKSVSFGKDFNLFEYFRTDQEKRDFVSGGAAAGVAAAFGAPVGGVLFSLEEGASFWNQALTWRILFCSMTASFTFNAILSFYHNVAWSLSYPGLISFGEFEDAQLLSYNGLELPIFLLVGCVGGLFGALFNFLNTRLTLLRIRHVYRKGNKVLEALVVALMSATTAFLLVYLSHDCEPLGRDPTTHPVQLFCKDGEYNVMASLFFQNPESSVRSLFHDRTGTFNPLTVGLFALFYFLLAVWAYGLQVPSGIFIPLLLTGSAWGRLIGIGLNNLFQDNLPIYPGKYALLGAAAMLGGVVRMTISLTVIMMEATGSVAFGLPLMLVLMCAKWVGDFFNEGIYDIHIRLAGVPFLHWEAPLLTYDINASQVMSHPVTTLLMEEKVERVYKLLKETKHDGYPVVDQYIPDIDEGPTFGRFQGTILRSQLLYLLKNKAFSDMDVSISIKDFREAYPRYVPIEQIELTAEDMQKTINLREYMNAGAYAVSDKASLPRIFKIFRGLGLRHLIVVNQDRKVVGMVTRSDLARFRVEFHRGKLHRHELPLAK